MTPPLFVDQLRAQRPGDGPGYRHAGIRQLAQELFPTRRAHPEVRHGHRVIVGVSGKLAETPSAPSAGHVGVIQ